jgi:hypothetical protein
VQEPTAQWNPETQLWEGLQADLFSEQPVPFSETWPTSGMTRSGRLFPLPASAHPTNASECSSSQLLPTPRATDGTKGGPNQRGSSGDLMLPSAVMDL